MHVSNCRSRWPSTHSQCVSVQRCKPQPFPQPRALASSLVSPVPSSSLSSGAGLCLTSVPRQFPHHANKQGATHAHHESFERKGCGGVRRSQVHVILQSTGANVRNTVDGKHSGKMRLACHYNPREGPAQSPPCRRHPSSPPSRSRLPVSARLEGGASEP